MSAAPARYTLSELSERFELPLEGDPDHEVCRVATLQDADADGISFLANPAYRPMLESSRAGAVIVRPGDAGLGTGNRLLAEDPYISYARIAVLFDARPVAPPGIHASASIDPTAQLGRDVHVGPMSVVGADCEIGDGCSIGPGCVVGDGSRLGAGSRLVASVTLADGVNLGQRVLVHPGAVIGADGFGIARAGDHWEKVPQLGGVVIGDDCEIGANTTIDRGAIGDTVLEADVHIDNLCQVGHNCHIGAHTAMAACTGISGSTRVGRNCLLAGQVGVHGHLEIADGVTIAGKTMVRKSITEPGTTWSSSIPAQPIREWQKVLGQLRRLDRTLRGLRKTGNKEPQSND